MSIPHQGPTATRARILIADDSSTFRRVITQKLEQNPSLQVIAQAKDGKEAIELYTQHKPDIVILDVFMPAVDGIEALGKIREINPDAKVFVYSSIIKKRVGEVYRTITELGAIEFFEKPSGAAEVPHFLGSLTTHVRQLANHILSAAKPSANSLAGRAEGDAISLRPVSNMAFMPKILAIGSSTGGPQALIKMLKPLKGKCTLPIVITQHMPTSFTAMLAKQINDETGFPAQEGAEGMELMGGQVYVAPGDYHMRFEMKPDRRVLIRLEQDEPINFCRPAVDPMFESLAHHYRGGVLAVVLTGMGSDGLKGATHLMQSDRHMLIAQDKETSVVWGMPAAVAKAGICNHVLPLPEISHKILTILGHK